MNNEQTTNESSAVGQPPVGDRPAATAPMAPTPSSPPWPAGVGLQMGSLYRCRATGRIMKVVAASVIDNQVRLAPTLKPWSGSYQQLHEDFDFISPYKAEVNNQAEERL